MFIITSIGILKLFAADVDSERVLCAPILKYQLFICTSLLMVSADLEFITNEEFRLVSSRRFSSVKIRCNIVNNT